MLWLGSGLIVALGAWSVFRFSQTTPPPPPAKVVTPVASETRSWVVNARTVARRFPVSPELWREAGFALRGIDEKTAQTFSEAALFGLGPSALSADESGLITDLVASAADYPRQAALAKDCTASASRARLYAGWLALQNRTVEALAWIDQLPAATARDPGVHAFRAALLCQGNDSDLLRDELARGSWGNASSAAVELAVSARLAAQRGRENLRSELWGAAIAACSTHREALTVVLQLAQSWNFRAEAERTWQALAALPPVDPVEAKRFTVWQTLTEIPAPPRPVAPPRPPAPRPAPKDKKR